MPEERTYNKIIVVDENNENPRAVTFAEAIEHKWIRRAARVFIVNSDGLVLIQQRSRYISKPLLLDNSAAGHVDEGEEYIDAAVRELAEETGINVSPDDLVVLPMLRETNFFAQNYLLRVSNDQSLEIDPHETEAFLWLAPDEIDALIAEHPERCTDSLRAVWPHLRDTITTL